MKRLSINFDRFDRRQTEVTQIEQERKHILGPESDFFMREAYKTLRTNVSFALADEEKCKTVIITSAMKSEGKSATAINLAISYAEMNRRVLLMDCDLRRPKIARLLDAQTRTGLSNLLVDPELCGEAILTWGTPNLHVLLSGDVPPNPSELLASSRFKRLMEKLRENYDYILLDTSPVNVVTDACVLVPESTGVLFAVRAGSSDRNAVRHAIEQLEYSKAKILGFVLNGVEPEKSGYGYRYGRYRRSSYASYQSYESPSEREGS